MHPLYLRLSSFYFAYFLMLGAFAPFFGLYLKDLGFSSLEIGVLLAIVPVVRTALPTVWGWIADHYGHRRALIRVTSVAAALVCTGLLAGTSFGWLFAVLLLLNVFWCAALPLVEATTFGLLKGRLGDYGRIRVWGSVSFVLARWCSARRSTGPAWESCLQCWWCCSLPWRPPPGALPADETPVHHEEHASLGRILRRPEVAALFVACFLMSLAHGPYNSFYSIHLEAAAEEVMDRGERRRVVCAEGRRVQQLRHNQRGRHLRQPADERSARPRSRD